MNLKILENYGIENVTKLLVEDNIVFIFNGRSESGPRSLGNRSLLFNPIFDNKKRVNDIKGREDFRPLACSILLEECNKWFEMGEIKDSPYMTYSFNVKDNKKSIIPSIVHVDGTCRLQTVSKNQNQNYYNIIKSFFDITNVPLIGNTSFNLAGYPIVENIEDAIDTLYYSKINFLYFPEIDTLISK